MSADEFAIDGCPIGFWAGLVLACAFTLSEKGVIGRMEGNIGMGAAFALVPLAQVARLLAKGLYLTVDGAAAAASISLTVLAWTGVWRGDGGA